MSKNNKINFLWARFFDADVKINALFYYRVGTTLKTIEERYVNRSGAAGVGHKVSGVFPPGGMPGEARQRTDS